MLLRGIIREETESARVSVEAQSLLQTQRLRQFGCHSVLMVWMLPVHEVGLSNAVVAGDVVVAVIPGGGRGGCNNSLGNGQPQSFRLRPEERFL